MVLNRWSLEESVAFSDSVLSDLLDVHEYDGFGSADNNTSSGLADVAL
jgi:hypothetical protein